MSSAVAPLLILQLLCCSLSQVSVQAVTLKNETVSPTSVHVTWEFSSDERPIIKPHLTVTRSKGSFQMGLCNESEHTLRVDLSPTDSEYTVQGLMEYSTYSITLYIDSLSISDTISITTLQAAPTDAPTDVQVLNITAGGAVTLLWGGVPCIHRNSNISKYAIRYGIASNRDRELEEVSGNDEEGGIYTITGLYASRNYSIQVAAVNTVGEMGPFSEAIIAETEPCPCGVPDSHAIPIIISTVSTFAGTTIVYFSTAAFIITAIIVWKRQRSGEASEETSADIVSTIPPRRWCLSSSERTATVQVSKRSPAYEPTDPTDQDFNVADLDDYCDMEEDKELEEEEYYANEADIRSMTSQFSHHHN